MTSKPRKFTDAGVHWEARRQGDPGNLDELGISFTSDAGHRFLKMTYPELPSQTEFEDMSDAQLVDLLARASL